jgi:hypothetical protein
MYAMRVAVGYNLDNQPQQVAWGGKNTDGSQAKNGKDGSGGTATY